MARNKFRCRLVRVAMAVAMGGSVFQLSGCDPTVRASLITGIQSTTLGLTDTLINAFFLSLQDDSSSSGGTTTISP